jgi:hypothetical protein
MKARTLTFTVAIRAAPIHIGTGGWAGRPEVLVSLPEDASLNAEVQDARALDSSIATTPVSQCDAPAVKANDLVPQEGKEGGPLSDATACPGAQADAAMTPYLEGYIEDRIDAAVTQAVEEAVERAMESFCEYELEAHIEETLRWNRTEETDKYERLEARVNELEYSEYRVDSDEIDQIKCDMDRLSLEIEAQKALTNTMEALCATCDALARRVAGLELKFASRTKKATVTTSARSRGRAV